MFVDEVDIHVEAGHGGRGCLAFRREKFVPARRPERRRRRPRRLGLPRRQPAHQHPHQLPVPSRVRRAERGEHGEGSNCTGHGGADLELAGPDRHARLREDRRAGSSRTRCSPISPKTASACSSRKGGRGGLGNARFATSTNRAPRKVQPGEAGRDQGSAPRAEAARRRRPGRLPQRRQVDADRAHLRGAAEDRRLPVHHADAEPRRRRLERRPQLRRRRRARADRRRARGHGPRPPVPAAPRAHARCSCTWSTCRARAGRDPVDDLDIDPAGARAVSADARREAADRRREQDRRASTTTDDASPRCERRAAELRPAVLPRSPASTGAGVPELLEAMWQRAGGAAPTPVSAASRDARRA